MIIKRKKQYSGENQVQPDLSKNNPAEQESLIRQIPKPIIPQDKNVEDYSE